MYNILVYGMGTVYGGIENVIINYFRNIDKSKLHFDFTCSITEKNKSIAFAQEIKEKDGNIYYIHSKFRNPIKHNRELKEFFKNNAIKYDCAWINISDLSDISFIKYAKKYGIKRIIIHSHNSEMISVGVKRVIKSCLHNFNKKRIDNYATDYWACSQKAKRWLYPEKLWNKVVIIKNAIDIKRANFDQDKRAKIRNKYNLESSFVIGHIGRLDFQKNQVFVIKIFKRVLNQIPNSKLIFVGDGKDYQLLKHEVEDLGISDKVIFAGLQKDVKAWYSAFDVFLFPSLFEGLSLALLEAQANGLPVLTSDTVSPKEVKINNNFFVEKLNSNSNIWCEDIKKIHDNSGRINNNIIYNNFLNKGYEIKVAAKKLQDMFLQDR